ncbi:hypothetical protein EPO33_01600 [Patescibacteria group bacterium]|nr:MAG: hypothetical protein EPO33_01600 [Patescibacteria group bacterium]
MRWKLNLRILENAWVRSFTWRGDIFFYRLQDVVNPLAQIIIWESVFRTRDTFGGYTHETMLSYVLVSTFFFALSRNWITGNVGEDIKEGKLNQYLVKPLSYITYNVWMGIGRTALATLFALAVVAVLVVAYRGSLYIPDLPHFALALAVTLAAFFMNMLLSIALGLAAFWMTSVEGFGNAVMFGRNFLAGSMFPLDIVSPLFVSVSAALPFAYTSYVPAQIFLGKMTIAQGLAALAVVGCWTMILYIVVRLEWRFGIRRYEGTGI